MGGEENERWNFGDDVSKHIKTSLNALTFVGFEFDGKTSYHRIDSFGAGVGGEFGPSGLNQHRLDTIMEFLQILVRFDGRIQGRSRVKMRMKRVRRENVRSCRGRSGRHDAAVDTVEIRREIEMMRRLLLRLLLRIGHRLILLRRANATRGR